jgi:hypothetical protein
MVSSATALKRWEIPELKSTCKLAFPNPLEVIFSPLPNQFEFPHSTVEPFPAERTTAGMTAPTLVSFPPALNVVLFFDRPADSPRTSPLSAFNQGIALCQALFFLLPLSIWIISSPLSGIGSGNT